MPNKGMKIIVGLGNPGEKYLKTRHNLGFMVVDKFASEFEFDCSQRKFQSLFCKKTINQEEIILLKPQTFMNLSGVAVKEAVAMYKCQMKDLLVICDDMDLPPGTIRMRRSGGCGGHRGMESVASHLGSTDFPRLRVGIGRSGNGDQSKYVLSALSKEEERSAMETIETACLALKTWIFEGIDVCMNKFN